MNSTTAKDYLPLVQALANGETIQRKEDGEWIDLSDPAFRDFPSTYRIKPIPLELWVNEFYDGSFDAFPQAALANEASKMAAWGALRRGPVHMKEVE